MSHLPQRKENNCLNCNAEVAGRYCQVCGQQNIEPKESVWHLINHFFQDITHFDGKFFNSIALLMKKPGYLPAEYARGRRASYLNPVRLYIFTSALFFLLFFAFVKPTSQTITQNSTINGKTLRQIEALDSAEFAAFTSNINLNNNLGNVPMSREQFKVFYDTSINGALRDNKPAIRLSERQYSSRQQYDSFLKNGVVKHNAIERAMIYKNIEINKKYKGREREFVKDLLENFQHRMPQMLFISLPLLALILQLLYIRRKEFFYVSHSIFSIYFYVFVFIILLIILLLGKASVLLNWPWVKIMSMFLYLGILIYLYLAMRHFYHQAHGKTVLKFIMLLMLSFLLLIALFICFIAFSVFSI